jgi:hypothetical protein
MPDTEIQIRSIERIHYQTKGKGEKKMKTRKLFVGMAIAIIALAFAIIGCQQDEPTSTSTPPPPTVTIGGKTIPVSKAADVSDADFNMTVENLKTAILSLNTDKPAYIAANTTKIEIGVYERFTLNAGLLRIPAGADSGAIVINLNSITAS